MSDKAKTCPYCSQEIDAGSEIKNCPFCGDVAWGYVHDPYDGYQGDCSRGRVRCQNKDCGAMIESRYLEDAILKWNRRAEWISDLRGAEYDTQR